MSFTAFPSATFTPTTTTSNLQHNSVPQPVFDSSFVFSISAQSNFHSSSTLLPSLRDALLEGGVAQDQILVSPGVGSRQVAATPDPSPRLASSMFLAQTSAAKSQEQRFTSLPTTPPESPGQLKFATTSHKATARLVPSGGQPEQERPFSCNFSNCEKRFASASKLTRHHRVHTGEKPYECNLCDKRFSVPFALNDHKRTHSGERPFVCQICNKGFAHHSHLTRHRRVHTGERPHKCEYDGCEKRFSQQSDLTKHRRTHTGEKPYECDFCGKCFAVASALTRHKRTHKKNQL